MKEFLEKCEVFKENQNKPTSRVFSGYTLKRVREDNKFMLIVSYSPPLILEFKEEDIIKCLNDKEGETEVEVKLGAKYVLSSYLTIERSTRAYTDIEVVDKDKAIPEAQNIHDPDETLIFKSHKKVFPKLLIKRPDKDEYEYLIDKEECYIGRGKDNDIVLDLGGVSRKHALIHRIQIGEDTNFLISDMGSKDGTFVNKVKLGKEEKGKLKNGDIISITEVDIKFVLREK